MKKLNVLVACECSGVVRDAFRKLGHNAWSCDLQPCDGNPRYHIQGDVLRVIGSPMAVSKAQKGWDLIIAHPPCTYLCNSGVHWLYHKGSLELGKDRWTRMIEAAKFFREIYLSEAAPHIAVENPIPHKHAVWAMDVGKSYDQIIQPWQFGHPESKATCLWLKNLPKLKPTKVLKKSGPWANQTPSGQNKLGPSPLRAKLRARTYEGIALAMATQWSEYILHGSAPSLH